MKDWAVGTVWNMERGISTLYMFRRLIFSATNQYVVAASVVLVFTHMLKYPRVWLQFVSLWIFVLCKSCLWGFRSVFVKHIALDRWNSLLLSLAYMVLFIEMVVCIYTGSWIDLDCSSSSSSSPPSPPHIFCIIAYKAVVCMATITNQDSRPFSVSLHCFAYHIIS